MTGKPTKKMDDNRASGGGKTWSKRQVALVALLALGLGLVGGCLNRDLRPLNPCTVSGVINEVKVTTVDKIDMLFMVDNSNSMAEEQNSLVQQFPRLIQTLASGEVRNTAGEVTRSFPAVASLQVGVVDSDMGTGGFLVPTCTESNFGDDGILRTRGNTAISGCTSSYPSFLTFTKSTDDPAAFAADFTCVAALGTGGCGFEQQLDAVLKALTPSSSSTTFVMGSRGHGDVANDGFLRANSLLGIIIVSDEDDCSALDPDLFNQSSPRYMGDLNLRCFQFPEAVYPTSRYVTGLLDLRPGNPELLVYAAIVGVPVELVSNPETIDYGAILSDPRMQQAPDPSMPSRLTPSCTGPGRGLAFPPVRMVQVARDLDAAGAGAVVQSICQEDFTGAIDAIINKLADVLGGACLPRALNPDSTGAVNCNVVEVLPSEGDITNCDQLVGKGRTFLRTEVDTMGIEHQVCTVTQLNDAVSRAAQVAPDGMGWFYDDFTDDVDSRCGDDNAANGVQGQRISFTTGSEPSTGVTVRLECLQPVSGNNNGEIGLDSPCLPSDGASACGSIPGLFCRSGKNVCAQTCSSDADCAGAGLGGFVCASQTGQTKCGIQDPEAPMTNPNEECFCSNPTCGGSGM
jgi:hypothetical protein